jgi:hypothetical protein
MDNPEMTLISKASANTRGYLIEMLAGFESLIDFYITIHFTGHDEKDKFEEFVSLIIAPNVTLSNKIEIFRALVDKYHPKFLAKNKNYWTDFVAIVKMRNVVAHYPINTSPSAIAKFKAKKIIQYIKFKKYTEQGEKKLLAMVEFTEKYTNEQIDLIHKYKVQLRELLK